ncbi:MAG: T9SS type A sorting domain-containing protein [Fimbriimonadaceae bacterium]|nr:T9SS type A sorting domain-containing protein [Chitinophagales bacterium]
MSAPQLNLFLQGIRITRLLLLLIPLKTFSQTPVDAKIMDNGPVHWLVPGNYPLEITLTNNDVDFEGIYSIDASWQIDGGTIHACTVDEFMFGTYIPSGFIAYCDIITHTDELEFTEPGIYNLKVWTSLPNGYADEYASDDTLYTTVRVVDSLPEKYELLYFGTHQNCFPCGGIGEENLGTIHDTYGDAVNVVRIHAEASGTGEDIFATDESNTLNDLYVWNYTGHPAFLHDLYRFPVVDYSFIAYTIGNVEGVEFRKDFKYPIEVSVKKLEMDTITRTYSGEVHAKFYADYDGALSMNAIITEDSLYAYQMGYPDIYLWHMNIMRDMTAGVMGDNTIIPLHAIGGLTYVYPFSGILDEEFNYKLIYVTGIVQIYDADDSLHAEILNSGRTKLTDFNTEDIDTSVQVINNSLNTINIFPNPANDVITISGNIIYDAAAEIIITDLSGKILMQQQLNALSKDENIRLNIQDIASGIYFLQIQSGEYQTVSKIEIVR